jgi:hypothetical protein
MDGIITQQGGYAPKKIQLQLQVLNWMLQENA